MTLSLRAATVQFQHRANDKNYNLSTMERFITEAAEQQIQLLAFPEMCITGYWHVRHLSDAEVRARWRSRSRAALLWRAFARWRSVTTWRSASG